MNSPKYLKPSKHMKNVQTDHPNQIAQPSTQSLQIKPWNSNRIAKIATASITNNNGGNIFTISHRSNTIKQNVYQNKIFTHSITNKLKPKTAPNNAFNRKTQYKPTHNKTNLSQELTRLGPVATQQVLDDDFQQNLESINFYPQFRASVQPKRNLLYLKPYLNGSYRHRKSNLSSFDRMEKMKAQLYKGINQSQQIYAQQQQQKMAESKEKSNENNQNLNTNRSVIQYMTEYQGQQNGKKTDQQNKKRQLSYQSSKTKQVPIAVLRQKLKNRYKQSYYTEKIIKIKKGQAVPITILQ